jgi:hypothetical protein
VKKALARKSCGHWAFDDDSIFAAHTSFVDSALKFGAPLWPTHLWHQIEPLVQQAETSIAQRTGQPSRIHKGAPYFNVGLCYFLSGNFEHAFQYFAEAGVEDEKSGRGARELVPIGENSLSIELLIRPLTQRLIPLISTSYLSSIGAHLTESELRTLINWLAARPIDAFQTISGLHRLLKLLDGPENDVSKQLRVRAVADLVLSVESSIRRWQNAAGQQLQGRFLMLLQSNPVARSSFTNFDGLRGQNFPGAGGETIACINWVIEEMLSRMQTLPSVSERVGSAAFLVARLRNNLMHVNDPALSIYNDKDKLLQIVGLVMGTLKLSKLAQEGTLGTLQ